MSKTLLYILLTVIILVIGLNLGNFSSDNKTLSRKTVKVETPQKEMRVERKALPKKTEPQRREKPSDNHLNDEIQALLKKAENLLNNSKESEALEIYNLIIEKIGEHHEPKLLKHFAKACMLKAFLYQIYPNIDQDSAIEAYTMVINKFEKSNNPELLKLYIDAKVQLARLLPLDERLDIYDELIQKFEHHQNSTLQKEFESLLISKSFELMGKDNEESMRILDKVIEKYQDKESNSKLPESIQFSILNNIELGIITNNENDHYIELAEKFMSDVPDTKPLLDMLSIIKEAQNLNQDEALAKWKEEHADYHFPNWSFQELERWANSIEDRESKARISEYLNIFVNQKYNRDDKTIPYENSSSTSSKDFVNNGDGHVQYDTNNIESRVPTAEEIYYDDAEIKNEQNSENQNNIYEEEPIVYPNPYENSEPIIYEEDPYFNEIYDATGEYSNTYK